MVYQNFGKAGSYVGSTIIKTCPSGDYKKDNYCGEDSGWVELYTSAEKTSASKDACCLKLTWKSDPPYMSDS